MRLAGTCSRYSNSAMPQLTSAAMYQGLSARFFRWPYQAKVMKTFEATSSTIVCSGDRQAVHARKSLDAIASATRARSNVGSAGRARG